MTTENSHIAVGPLRTSLWQQKLLFVFLATALPMTVVFSCMWLMVSTYTTGFNVDDFVAQYGSSVYRYRLLGKELLLMTYRLLLHFLHEKPFPLPQEQGAQFVFYTALVLLNGAFFFLSNLTLLGLLWMKGSGFRDAELSAYFFYTLLLAMSMAVVTPYDQMAYFFLLLGLYAIRTMPKTTAIPLFAASVVAGALTRETELLAGSVIATVAIFHGREKARKWWGFLALHMALFATVYLWLRIRIPGTVEVVAKVSLGGQSRARFLTAVLYPLLLAAAILLILRMRSDARPALVLLAASSPYIVAILLGGIYTELRLMMPVVLGIFCVYILLRQAQQPPLGGAAHQQ